HVDAVERPERGRALPVDLDQAAQADQRWAHPGAPEDSCSVMTCMPGWSSPPVISVSRPSLIPVVTVTGCATPSRSTQISRTPPTPSAFRLGRADRGAPCGRLGISLERIPPLDDDALEFASGAACAGVKRSAVFGTRSTSCRSMALIVADAVIPGRRLRSPLSTSSSATYVTTLSVVVEPKSTR